MVIDVIKPTLLSFDARSFASSLKLRSYSNTLFSFSSRQSIRSYLFQLQQRDLNGAEDGFSFCCCHRCLVAVHHPPRPTRPTRPTVRRRFRLRHGHCCPRCHLYSVLRTWSVIGLCEREYSLGKPL